MISKFDSQLNYLFRYSFALDKLICLGYVSRPGHYQKRKIFERRDFTIDNFILDPSAQYEIDLAGRRFQADPHMYPPKPAYSSTRTLLDEENEAIQERYVPVVNKLKKNLSWADFCE